MAYNDTEIEIKIPLEEKTFLEIREKLQKEAKFVKKILQDDKYFSPSHRYFLAPEFPFEWLSVRRRGDKAVFNYKRWYPENAEFHTHCDEFETEISDPEKLEKIFSALDFKELIAVKKQREVYNYGDEFEIGLDMVDDLGYFMEIETTKDFGSVKEARKKIFKLAEKLGVDASRPDARGYPYNLMKRRGLLK